MPGGSAPGGASPAGPSGSQVPPLQETYQAGVRDYNAARYAVAAGEFEDVVHYYPLDDMAGNAQFYLGEIAYRQQNYPDAVKAYNAVLEGFSGSPKAPGGAVAHRIGPAADEQEGRGRAGTSVCSSNATRKLPKRPQARTKLNGLGVKPSAGR